MQQTAARQNYLLWLKDRGIRYPVVRESVRQDLTTIRAAAAVCQDCALSSQRTQIAFGYGSETARIVFVGDGPLGEADTAGTAFAGEERVLLDRMIAAMQLAPDAVYVTNALLCRMSDQTAPDATAFAACRRHLSATLATIKPKAVVALGGFAARALLGDVGSFQTIRGRFIESPLGLPVLVTFHPRDLLRFPETKRQAWADLKVVMASLCD